jgi:hypothetical protein
MPWEVISILVFLLICWIIAYLSYVHDLEREVKELKKGNKPLSPSQGPGWSARLSKRGLKPAQNIHLGIMDEGDAVKSILQMGYKPQDIKSLEYLQ